MMFQLAGLLIAASVFIWLFAVFSLIKKYRYATCFTDMLSIFPVLIVLSLIIFGATVYVWFNITDALSLIVVFGILCSIPLCRFVKWRADYSVSRYISFLEAIDSSRFSIHSFHDYAEGSLDSDRVSVFVRHDVDISLGRATMLAEIEKRMGVHSTFFFRLHAEKYDFEQAAPLIKKLSDEGFEIGLHYETLSIAKGNHDKAIELLSHDIERLRKIAPVNVVAAHGQKVYKNREIWEEVDKAALQVSSAYDMKYDLYLSDAGGKPLSDKHGKYLFDRIYEAKPGQIVQVLIHPDWWC